MELTLACMVYVKIVHYNLLTLNMKSARYLQLGGIIANRTSFCVVSLSFSAAFATLIPHFSLKYSDVVFKCRSVDKKACGCLMSVRLFGGYGTLLM